MTIPEKAVACNKANIFIDSVLAQGNVVPHLWYRALLKNCGKPDTVAISVLSDLANLYRDSCGRTYEFQLSYLDLSSKFNYSPRQLYDGIVRLENRGLVKRRSDTIEVKGRPLGNFLFLTLNIDALLELHINSGTTHTTDSNSIKSDFLFTGKRTRVTCKNLPVPYIDNNNLRNNNLDINDRLLVKESSNELDNIGKFNKSGLGQSVDFTKPNSTDPVDSPGLAKSDNSSNLHEFSSVEVESNKAIPNEAKLNKGKSYRSTPDTLILWLKHHTKKPKTLKLPLSEFHPLSEKDVDTLRLSSGRDFNASFVNQLLSKLGSEKPKHAFASKERFMKYMTKALAYEMRQAVAVNNESFKLIRNTEDSHIESYLHFIENSSGTTPFEQLRKKIAAHFDPVTSYKILTKARFYENRNNGTFSVTADNSILELLTPNARERLFDAVRATYGNHINYLNISLPESIKKAHLSHAQDIKPLSHYSKPLEATSPKTEVKALDGVWGKIRQGLIDHYGSKGAAMDSAWFGKLEADADTERMKITLKAPTKFIKDWIQVNYSCLINNLCRLHNYNLQEISI